MGNYFNIMRFFALVLALLVIMNFAEASATEESSELMSARCRRIAKKFVRHWYKIDRNKNGRIYWAEMYRYYVKWARKHGWSWSKIRKYRGRVYRHWKKWAGSKGYVWWKHVWNYIRKRNHC